MIVDFFIVGAPKAGTTSLYQYLSEHPDVKMSSEKEPNYFSHDLIHKQRMYYKEKKINTIEKYHRLFDGGNNFKKGEASVSYLFYSDVPKKIKKYNSEAKIIIMLRNPIERAFSHYLMDRRLGLVDDSFEDIIYKRSLNKNLDQYFQQYLEVGQYSVQIKRYMKEFEEEKILIIDYEEFKNNTISVVQNVYSFLGLETNFLPETDKKHNVALTPKNVFIRFFYSFSLIRKMISYIAPAVIIRYIENRCFDRYSKLDLLDSSKDYLRDYFYNDIDELSKIIKKDLSAWKK